MYKNNPDNLRGPFAQFFSQYTVPKNVDYGFTSAAGYIRIISNDPSLTQTIQAKEWYDSKYALNNSIFAPYIRSNSVNMNNTFRRNVTIGIELASLNEFAEYFRKLIWQQLFKGAMYLLFAEGKGVCPYFCNECRYDLSAVYKDSNILEGDDLLSTIATPTITMFKEQIKLNSIVLEFPELVKTFNTFSNALEVFYCDESVMDVPGSSRVGFISHIISIRGEDSNSATLRLSNAAYSGIKSSIYCGEFYGALRFINSKANQSLVVVSGLVFELVNGEVTIAKDLRVSPSKVLLSQHLTDLQFSLVASEARLNFLLSKFVDSDVSENLALMRSYLLWLGGVAGHSTMPEDAGTSNLDLTALQARALYLAKCAAEPSDSAGLPVPYLKYEAYMDTMNNVQNVLETSHLKLTSFQSQIRDRKAEEREIKRENQLNENIIKTGKLLNDYISAQASYQGDLTDQFSSVISDKEKEIDLLTARQASLSSKLYKQQSAVRKSVEDYKEAVAEWRKNQIIKAALDIASSLFTLGFSFAIPSGSISALAELGKTVQRIQKAVNIFDALIKTYNSFKTLPKDPKSVVDALGEIGPDGFQMPTSLEWSEMKVKMDATLDKGPNIGAKVDLSAAFSILVLRGRALLDVQNQLQAKLGELSAAYSNKRVHNNQRKRLSELRAVLDAKPDDLDVNAVDLVGLSGQLVFFQRQMLIIMASTLVIQDRALQYEYLQPPVPVKSFSFLNLQFAIVCQSQSITKGLTAQPMPVSQPEPIVYEVHGLRPENLTNNNSYAFTIFLNKREFSSYNYVRVERVEAEIGGILSTKSGKYYTELTFEGDPFMDRDFQGRPRTFQTVPRLYTFLDDVCNSCHSKNVSCECSTASKANSFLLVSGVPINNTDDNPFRGKVSNITPFSTWRISLPPTKSNEDILFDDSPVGVTVRLTFHIYAQLKEYFMTTAERVSSAFLLRTRDMRSDPVLASAVQPPSGTSVSRSVVLNSMTNKSVCGGWDVVFSMGLNQVNKNFYKQYQDRIKNPVFLRCTGDITKEFTDSNGTKHRTRFNFEFLAPKLEFILNNPNSAIVTFPIKKGHYVYYRWITDQWKLWKTADITEADEFSVEGHIPLAILQGKVLNKLNISLELNSGRFSSQHFKPGTDNPGINDALEQYFTEDLENGYEVYNLGTLDMNKYTVLESLKPSKITFNVYQSPSERDMLQIFIATTGRPPRATLLNLQEPYPSMFESSLIISSKIAFSDIIPTSIGNAGIGLVLTGVEPANNEHLDKAWSTKASAGSISGQFPPIVVDYSCIPYHGEGLKCSEGYVAVPGDVATLPLNGMLFTTPSGEWDVKMKMHMDKTNYKFKYGSRYKFCGMFQSNWSSIFYSDFNLKISVDLAADLKFEVSGKSEVSGKRQNQVVQLSPIATTESLINGDLEPPAGACKCNDRELQKTFLYRLRSGMTPRLTSMLKKDFSSISLFALKNILFPAEDFIALKEIYLPGDLVVFGDFS
jgi:hypothetical protein